MYESPKLPSSDTLLPSPPTPEHVFLSVPESETTYEPELISAFEQFSRPLPITTRRPSYFSKKFKPDENVISRNTKSRIHPVPENIYKAMPIRIDDESLITDKAQKKDVYRVRPVQIDAESLRSNTASYRPRMEPVVTRIY